MRSGREHLHRHVQPERRHRKHGRADQNVPVALTPNSFTRAGYAFTGWNTAANGSGTAYADQAVYSFTASVTLYAQWAVATFTVTFNANGGTGQHGRRDG